ncbi:MAG: ExeM/NucH family extracellular endonuclease [Arachnia sp.]
MTRPRHQLTLLLAAACAVGGLTLTAPTASAEPDLTPIAEIQGTGSATPIAGTRVTTKGVVTAAYPTGGFNGFYIQTPGSGRRAKSAGDASDGIFVFSASAAGTVAPGDCVLVEGTAGEYNGLTQLTGSPAVTTLPRSQCRKVTPVSLSRVPATEEALEAHEGMLVLPKGQWTITNNYALNQFGQLGLTPGTKPLYVATDVVAPGPRAEAYEAANKARLITLDDGSSWNYMTNKTAQASPLPYLSAATPMRTGSQVRFTSPVVLDYRFQWNLQPTAQVVGARSRAIPVKSENDRERRVPRVGGDVQLASFNVLNYFTDLGENEDGCAYFADRDGNPVATDYCEVRGAWSRSAFEDQRAKIVAAINGTKAEVVALMEIENSAGISYVTHERDYTLKQLVADLNASGRTRWAYAPSPTVTPSNEDVIRTAFIYDADAVQLKGPSYIDLDEAFADARYPLAQEFAVRHSRTSFVAVANHFKSKSSGEDDGTGQGLANPSREAQARQLTAWVADEFRGKPVFLLGDFNAYAKETPVRLIERAGFTNVVKTFEPRSTTYQYQGRLGSLDHVFANRQAMRLVTDAAVWDINGDESIAFQYSRRNYNVVDFYSADVYASSDHDPVVVGLDASYRGKRR